MLKDNKKNADLLTKPDDVREVKREFESYEGDEPFIFVSYAHADEMEVMTILKKMYEEKFRFWYDDTMEVGEDFRNELKARVESCAAFVIFVSEGSMKSKYCGMELITAYKNNKKIFPIYMKSDVEIPEVIKMLIENLQHVNYSMDEDNRKYLSKLYESLPIETKKSLESEKGVIKKCRDGSKNITVPGDITIIDSAAFKNCEKLEHVEYGESLREIRREAFRGCKHLKSLYFPQNIKKIGESAFRDCIELKEIEITNDDIEIGERAFENCAELNKVILMDGITEIYGGVFNSCKALSEVKLPEKLTILGESSFADCVKLKRVELPPELTKLDDLVFNGCSELEEIIFDEALTKIGKSVFKDCCNLKRINFPSSLINIGTGPFRGCSKLEYIDVDKANRYFKSVDGVLFNKNKSVLISYPAEIDMYEYKIPDSVTEISDWAFSECTRLNKVEIPDSVYEIGEGAFYMCTSLKKIEIPNSVTRIDDTAFRGCVELEEVIIPSSVMEFGWGVFNGCDKIRIICDENSSAMEYCNRKNINHICKKSSK